MRPAAGKGSSEALALVLVRARSVLVGIRALDASIMVEALGAEELAPQLEVAVAALITMSCFRGIVARLRWR